MRIKHTTHQTAATAHRIGRQGFEFEAAVHRYTKATQEVGRISGHYAALMAKSGEELSRALVEQAAAMRVLSELAAALERDAPRNGG